MILYHGSNEAVPAPMILITKYAKDFSWGFYATESLIQAEKWAYRKAQLGGTPTVNIYEYAESPDLDIRAFSDTSDEWLDFVAHCRRGELHPHDIVRGPMADDTIWDYVQDYLDGSISKAAFLELAKFRHPTHQISFHTIAALKTLRFIEAKELVSQNERSQK